MEDVLLHYLQARKRTSTEAGHSVSAFSAKGDAPSWASGGSLTSIAKQTEADAFVKPSLPFPLCALFALVDSHKDYPASCLALAEMLKKLAGHYPLETVLSDTMQARFPRVWMERFLFSLLEVQTSDWQTAAYVLQFRHLKRVLLRVERKTPLNEVESALARELIEVLSLSRFLDFDPFCRLAMEAFKRIQAGKIPVSGDLGLLVYLIRCECTAMGERKNWLEADLGAGDPETVARFSPYLKLLEDRYQKAQEMAQRIGGYGSILEAPMGLEEAMGPFFFSHLKECLLRSPLLVGLKEVLDLQQAKRVPTRDLIALSSLTRWVIEARGIAAGPLEWVRMALDIYDRGHFRLDISGGRPAVEILLSEVKIEREGNLVLGNFGENPYSSWIARDGLTRPFQTSSPDRIPPNLRAIVMGSIHRDTVIIKMLDNPRVYGTPGLVEAIVEASRSTLVHGKIATRNELHSGSTNGRVPLALLRSPVSIPSALLRSLMHPSLIGLRELKTLYRGRSALRHEVVAELHTILKQASSV